MESRSLQIHPVIADNNTQRLNYFAGRYLSEQEFDLMQRYVDERCEDLLRTAHPGIVYGFDVNISEADDGLDIRVKPGLGVGGDGRAVHAHFPIHLHWASLIAEHKKIIESSDAVSGYYFLTVKRQVARIDEQVDADPCSRKDPDPLRDSRLETLATLDLQLISDLPSWMAMHQTRAAMHVLMKCLDEPVFDPDLGAVPVALLKIEHDDLQWIETRIGRFHSEINTVYHNMLSYWQSLEYQFIHEHADDEERQTLASILGVDCLPAAGPFPSTLVSNIAGEESGESEEENGKKRWTRPVLHFNPAGLQIELIPVPANTVEGIIHHELCRGTVDLVHHQQDRIRLMVAVNPDDYRPDLLNLPEIDFLLIKELEARYQLTAEDYRTWATAFFELYENLAENATFTHDKPDTITLSLFNSIYKVSGPHGDYPEIPEAARAILRIPASVPPPLHPRTYLDNLQQERKAQGEPIPRPYSQPHPVTVEASMISVTGSQNDGLYRRQADIKADIETIEKLILFNEERLEELTDFLGVQRQQLDSITVSFATLAGGVEGDGSGLNLMRWSDKLTYQAIPVVKEKG